MRPERDLASKYPHQAEAESQDPYGDPGRGKGVQVENELRLFQLFSESS